MNIFYLQPILQRASRFSVMRDLNEFGNRESNPLKRHRSVDGIKKKKNAPYYTKYNEIQSQYVSETDEELISDEDDQKSKRKKLKFFPWLSFLTCE